MITNQAQAGDSTVLGGTSSQSQVRDILMNTVPEQIDELAAQQEEETEEQDGGSETPAEQQESTPEESTDESSEEAEGEESEPDAAAEGDVEIHDLAALADTIGVDMPYLYGLKMQLSDEAEPVTLGEIKDRLQEQARVAAEREKLQTERNAFDEERTRKLTELSQMPEAILNAEAQVRMLEHQYQSTDWKALEEQDAGKAALYKQDLINAHQNAQQQAQGLRQQQEQERMQFAQQIHARENEALLSHIDSWKDPKVRQSESVAVTEMAAEYGFAPEELAQVVDHRAIRMMYDLYQSKQQQTKAEKTVQKIRKVPKSLRAGTPPKRVNVKKKALDDTLNRAAESKDMRQKASAIGDLLKTTGAVR